MITLTAEVVARFVAVSTRRADLTGRHAAGRPGLTRWPTLRRQLVSRRRWLPLVRALALPGVNPVEAGAWGVGVVICGYAVWLAGLLGGLPT